MLEKLVRGLDIPDVGQAELAVALGACDQVVGDDVIAISLADLLGEAPTLRFFAESQQVLSEMDPGGKEVRRELQGLALVTGAFAKAVLLRQLLSFFYLIP